MAGEGPLDGVRVVEFSGIGPGPFAGMILADMGAEVLTVDRSDGFPPFRTLGRGKGSLVLDLKLSRDHAIAFSIAAVADVVIEGFRPGVMERLNLGPDDLHAVNPRLIYGRMTGWGQHGPLAHTAGHDITYLALSGALAAFGPDGAPPVPPLNLLGDYGGGGMLLAFGIVAALFERGRSGVGQVIDAAIVDGAAQMFSGLLGMGTRESFRRGSSVLGGDAPFYRCYECADGRYVAVGAIELPFEAKMLAEIGLDPQLAHRADRLDPTTWPAMTRTIADRFAARPRDEWAAIFAGTDACVVPVLDIDEAVNHPHNVARSLYVEAGGTAQAVPAPRFSRTPGRSLGLAPGLGEGGAAMLARWDVADTGEWGARTHG